MYCGLLVVLSMTPSLLKSQAQEVGDPVEVSVNWTASGAVPEVGEPVKSATGAAGGAADTVI